MNKIFKLLIIGALFGVLLVLCLTFFKAFSSENKSVLVTINEYNEMWIEAILLPILVCLSIYLIYDEFKEIYNKKYDKICLIQGYLGCIFFTMWFMLSYKLTGMVV